MDNILQQLLTDNRVINLLRQVLNAVITDKKEKEEEPWEKLQKLIPKGIVGSLGHERVPGSPLVWAGGTQPYIMNVETGQHIKDWGMNKKAVQAFVKEIKSKVNELNGTTAAREAELAKNAAAKQAKIEAKIKAEEEARKRAEEEKKKAEEEAQKQAEAAKRLAEEVARKKRNFGSDKTKEAFQQQCGLDALGKNQTQSVWCSEGNRLAHRDGDTYKHHEQFGDISEEDYLKKAKALADKPVDGKNVWGYACYAGFKKNGTICRYDVHTHEYVKMNNQGMVTYYILETDSGEDEDIHQRFYNYIQQDKATVSKTEP